MKLHLTIFLLLTVFVFPKKPETPRVGRGDDYSKFRKTVELSDETSMSARIKVTHGKVHLGRCAGDQGFTGEFLFENRPPSIAYDVIGDQGHLTVRLSNGNKKNKDGDLDVDIDVDDDMDVSLENIDENEIYLNFTDRVPLDLEMEMGVVKGEWMLGGLQIENCKIAAAVSQTVIDFKGGNKGELKHLSVENGVGKLKMFHLADANFRSFSMEAGVGSYVLEFAGKLRQSANVDIEIGMGKMKLYLPRRSPVRIMVNKSFLSSFDINNVRRDDDTYTNDAWHEADDDTPRLDVYLDMGVASIDVEWIDSP